MRSGLASALLVFALSVLPLSAEIVPGRYIVLRGPEGTLKGSAAIHGEILQEIPLENFPSGWVMRMSAETAERAAREGYSVTPEIRFKILGDPPEQVQGPPVAWHLDRADQRMLPFDGLYRYVYTGAGVRAYVFDTGIFSGSEFGDRLDPGISFVSDGKPVVESCGAILTHSTVISSLLAGERSGIAKGATVVPVRIATCDGIVEHPALLQALDWLLSDLKQHPGARAVVNMSFGGRTDNAGFMDPFYKKLDGAGVVLVDAAGNKNEDACLYHPAGSRYTITAGGTSDDDRRWVSSNYGRCVDLFAPAQNIPSAGERDHNVIWVSSGTSASAPQVAGHIAQLLEQFPAASPAMIRRLLLANATPGVLSNLGAGSPNLLLYAGAFREEATRFIPRWFPDESRFTLQLRIGVPGGGTSPAEEIRLFRGPKRDGRCQGQPFATARPQAGAATVTVRGWKQAPAFVCAETSLETVFDRFVRTLN